MAMGQRIYRVDPPDVAGDVFDAEDARRLVGSGIYSRQPPARESRTAGSGRAKAARNAPASNESREG